MKRIKNLCATYNIVFSKSNNINYVYIEKTMLFRRA